MIIKNGQIYRKLHAKKNINKQSSFIFKNGVIFKTLTFKKVAELGYGQKVLSIISSNIGKVMNTARINIAKVIGV